MSGGETREHPREAYELYREAQSFGEQGMPDRAFESLSRIIDIVPDCPQAFYGMGKCCYTLGQYGDAVAHFDRTIRLRPDHARAWFRKGLALKKTGRYDEALKCINQSVQLTYGK